MQREIKFRGLNGYNREWVFGNLVKTENGDCFISDRHFIPSIRIPPEKFIEVIPRYVGQFTGLVDKNGVEIYEGDIICNYQYQTWEWRGVVKFSHGVFGAEWVTNIKSQSMVGSWGQKHNLRKLDDDILERLIVVGNIYENPSLLEVPS